MTEHKRYWLYSVSPDDNTVIGYQIKPKDVKGLVEVVDVRAYEEIKDLLMKSKNKVRQMERKLDGGWPIDRECE
jgi:hypothetical protein